MKALYWHEQEVTPGVGRDNGGAVGKRRIFARLDDRKVSATLGRGEELTYTRSWLH